MSGNPVKVGDGFATVTGYKLPRPLVLSTGKAGVRFEARSQDTGLIVLVRLLPAERLKRQCFARPSRSTNFSD